MTPKFTAADVVVGATVHIHMYMTSGAFSEERFYRGPVTDTDDDGKSVCVGSEWVSLCDSYGWTVEILDVVPPKPEHVVGGIYRIGSRDLREFFANGKFGNVGLVGEFLPGVYGDPITRVLVIDYPSDEDLDHLNWTHGETCPLHRDAIKAVRAEADRGVKS